ncbi:MAG: thiamine phosphate synthase [Pseudomonadota bacterium]|nr:thiamine phosphate synthase [Pseudomonadota bacterium]
MPTDAPRLYLITPPISDWTPYPPVLDEAMAACDVACVLLRTAARDEGEKENIVRALAPLVQKHGVACLVANDPQWAVRANADGVHVDGEGERLQSALRALKPGHIVGAGGLPTRDAAMTAGEAGADYVMFGGGAETHAQIVERVAWWAEIFNVPCVGYAHDLGAIGDLVRAGADFIALGDAVFADPRGAAAALHDAARLMAPTPEAAE